MRASSWAGLRASAARRADGLGRFPHLAVEDGTVFLFRRHLLAGAGLGGGALGPIRLCKET